MLNVPNSSEDTTLQNRFNQDVANKIAELEAKIKELEARIIVLEP